MTKVINSPEGRRDVRAQGRRIEAETARQGAIIRITKVPYGMGPEQACEAVRDAHKLRGTSGTSVVYNPDKAA